MRREKLRRRIAICIMDTLVNSSLSPQNVKRYVTSQTLSLYRIRHETQVTQKDLDVGLTIATNVARKSVSFRYAPRGSPNAVKRNEYILTAPLSDLI